MGEGRFGIFTVGHSNHTLEHFLNLLEEPGIEVVVDVRSVPRSAYAPQFDQEPLRRSLEERGIRYLYLGAELGGRPKGDAFYDAKGYVRYDRVAASPEFRSGLERVMVGVRTHRIALMCSEEDPSQCHRRLLITRVLVEHGCSVDHIRGDGRVEHEEGLPSIADVVVQSDLFGSEERSTWRSLRPVSRSGPPRSSSRP